MVLNTIEFINPINYFLLYNKILALFPLKAFADNKYNIIQ